MKRNSVRLARLAAAENRWPRGVAHLSDAELAAIVSGGRVLAQDMTLEQIQAVAQGADPATVFGQSEGVTHDSHR